MRGLISTEQIEARPTPSRQFSGPTGKTVSGLGSARDGEGPENIPQGQEELSSSLRTWCVGSDLDSADGKVRQTDDTEPTCAASSLIRPERR